MKNTYRLYARVWVRVWYGLWHGLGYGLGYGLRYGLGYGLRYVLGYGLRRGLGYELMIEDHKENKRGNDILAVRKVGHLNIKTKMFDFEARVLIGLQVNPNRHGRQKLEYGEWLCTNFNPFFSAYEHRRKSIEVSIS